MEASDQAGDPFKDDGIPDAVPNVSAQDRDGIAKSVEPAEDAMDATDRLDAIEALQNDRTSDPAELGSAMKMLDEFEADKEAQAAAESDYEDLSINEVRAIVKTTAEAVAVAEANLEKARKAYHIASLLEVDMAATPTLAELNRSQVKVTATEIRHKRRAMKALGALGYGDPKRKPHPQLFS